MSHHLRKKWIKKLKKDETICDSCSYKFCVCKRVSNAPCGETNDYFIYKPIVTLQQKRF